MGELLRLTPQLGSITAAEQDINGGATEGRIPQRQGVSQQLAKDNQLINRSPELGESTQLSTAISLVHHPFLA